MYGKWIYVVLLLDIVILSHSSPGQLRDFFNPFSWFRRGGEGGHWRGHEREHERGHEGGHWGGHERGHWAGHERGHWGGHEGTWTTQRTVEITTQADPYSAPPQPIITDTEIRLGQNDTTSILNSDPSVIQPGVFLAKNKTEKTFQPAVFTTGPEDESSKIKDKAAVNNRTIETVTKTNRIDPFFTSGLDNGTVELGTATNKTEAFIINGLVNKTVESRTANNGTEAFFTSGLENGTVEPETATNRTEALSTSGLYNRTVESGTATNRTEAIVTSDVDNGPVDVETATNKIGTLFISDLYNGSNKPGTASNGTVDLFTSDLDNGTISAGTATNETEALFNNGLNNGTIESGTGYNQSDTLFSSGKDATILPDGKKVWSQWHVVIYKKEAEFVDVIRILCGGSLVKVDMVISAAHCFWSSESQELAEPEKFLVVAGKVYSRWDDRRDTDSQYADVKNITITPTYPPCLQPDLAFVTLATPVIFSNTVKPVCINFNEDLEERQLRKGNFGTIASWEDLERLKWSSLPYVDVRVCSGNQISVNRQAGRICAGEVYNTTQSETDSGNGLIFYQKEIPYLRGVASINPDNRFCFKYNTRSFTNIGAAKVKAKGLIKEILDDLSNAGCEEFYKSGNLDRTALNGTASQIGETEEDSLVFSGASIGSWPVPSLPESSAPAFQWHVGVYSKAWSPYMQICGGSLVKRDVVISAAHCFWDDAAGQRPATQFAVAGGKLYRPWNAKQDGYAQHSNVSEIILPVRFRGRATNFQDDIAILRLASPFTYAPGVQSVCVDFDLQYDREQLQAGNIGTVAGWGLTEKNGRPSGRLNYLELPLIDVADCFSASEPSFLKYITSDKICAGDRFSGKALCRGDSGGGLIVISDLADTKPYLRGIASTAAANENLCNAFAIAAFTQIYAHRTFLRDNIPDIDKECTDLPGNRVKEIVTNGPKIVREVNDVESTGSTGTWNVVDSTRNAGAKPGERTQYTMPEFPNVPYHLICNCNCN